MDTYQGKIGTISPAFGNYDIQTFLNIDKISTSVTGIGATGVQGTGTLELVGWAQGVTGISGTNKNLSHGFYA